MTSAARSPVCTASSSKARSRRPLQTPRYAYKIDKFAKTLINAAPDAAGYDAVLGDPLEIVLSSNPASAHVGDEIGIKVLANGQPLATTVNATFDKFSKQLYTYAYATQSKADGAAVVKITQAGLWMVRVQNSVPEVTDLYDRHVTRAVLVFSIE